MGFPRLVIFTLAAFSAASAGVTQAQLSESSITAAQKYSVSRSGIAMIVQEQGTAR